MDQDMEPEWKLISLIAEIISPLYFQLNSPLNSLGADLISLVCSMELESQPNADSKFMSLITQVVNVFNSMDLDSQPEPLSKLIFYFSPENSMDMGTKDIYILFDKTTRLEPKPELISLIQQILFLVVSMISEWNSLIPLCPQGEAYTTEDKRREGNTMGCLPSNWKTFKLKEEEYESHFLCCGCNGENHLDDDMAPVEIKHPLHPKHSLQLLNYFAVTLYAAERICYCCGESLQDVVYHCSNCRLSINFSCSKKLPEEYVDYPKWHEHTLVLFSTQESVTCTLCALKHSRGPFYICPPCDFVVHQSCLGLPHVIRICRHHHRIAYTPSFDKGNWVCSVCREKIDNNYGGYSCIKEDCFYAAHSKCATQKKLWDGKELEGVPEEIEEEVAPFVKLSNEDIQHFSHPEDHHLRLDENTGRDYDENKVCQACITPIYFGNFYSCIQCDFILHESCAELSRKVYHPIHAHKLTLVPGYDKVMDDIRSWRCSACSQWMCIAGFFYNCDECHFKLHVQCAIISEPLVREIHKHPLFLTSKPGERPRNCSVCFDTETFNCIECDFSLCFKCATVPQKVRYKHDKHELILFYGGESSTMTYWCEVCENKVNPTYEMIYKCDEYCCVTVHVKCLIGKDLYMKPGTSWLKYMKRASQSFQQMIVEVVSNNQNMSRPICFFCKRRCPYNIVLQCNELIACSMYCLKR